MNVRNLSIGALSALVAMSVQHNALADCAGASVSEVRTAFAEAQKLEAQGKPAAALGYYVQAQEYTCEKNPVEGDAAKRAAMLSLPLAQAAEQRGDFELAFRLFENGGHFAKADAALIAHLRSKPDEPLAVANAIVHFENRSYPAFLSNNAVRLKLTGSYAVNPKHVAEVHAMPAKGVERALQQEAAAFNEEYLAERVRLTQSRPDSLSDAAAIQAAMSAQQAFVQKWREDLLKTSQAKLTTLRNWGGVTRDPNLAQAVQRSLALRIDQRVDVLTRRYSGAPEMLDAAIDYVDLSSDEPPQRAPRIAKIKAQAIKLGDAAGAEQRLALASEYYRVGGDEAKSKAAQERMRQAAMAKMQPSIDEMQRQAAHLQSQYADPEKVKAMKAEAEALRRNLQQQSGAAPAKGKSAADLEKELGL